jgi:8-oxo-dGTP diphosphatase
MTVGDSSTESCEHSVPFRPPLSLAVYAIVGGEDGTILLLRRSSDSKHFKHKWDLPGGTVDPGESFDVALVREVAEETGLAVEITSVAGASGYALPAVYVVVLFLEARRTAGEVRLSQEHDGQAWVAPENLCKMDFADHLRDFIVTYCAKHCRQPETRLNDKESVP